MRSPAFELVSGPFRTARRAVLGWSIGLGLLVAGTVAFWPAFKGSSGISQAIDQLPTGVVEAFGLQDFGTPAGFLRGNLYEIFVPLLIIGAAVAIVSGQTAREEAGGRLELFLAQPVDRRAVFLGRAVASGLAVIVIAVALVVVQFAADEAVGLAIRASYVVATIALCTLLAMLYGSLAFAIACLVARPAVVLGSAVGLAIAGYVVAALFPLSPALSELRHFSPWDWALGAGPLEHATDVWRYAALAIPSVLLVATGVASIARRDIASA
jgi:ABC-2 type transport system permease protein